MLQVQMDDDDKPTGVYGYVSRTYNGSSLQCRINQVHGASGAPAPVTRASALGGLIISRTSVV